MLALVLSGVSSARILCFFYFPSISHQYVFRQIAKGLSLKGHEVTFITPNPIGDPNLTNLTEINVDRAYKVFEKYDISKMNTIDESLYTILSALLTISEEAIRIELSEPKVAELLQKESDSFDLILIEPHCPILFGIQNKFNAPVVAVSSLNVFSLFHNIIGNSIHPVLYTALLSPIEQPSSSVMSKLGNLVFIIAENLMHEFYIYPSSDAIAREFFGKDMPYIKDLIKNMSMLMVNVNPIFSVKRPNVPNVMEFFNVHMDRKEKISQVSS